MQTIFYWAALCVCLVIAAGFFFIRAIQKKSMPHIYFSLVLLLIAGIMGVRAGWLVVRQSYHAVTEAAKSRTGMEVYKGMFGGPSPGCVAVLHVLEPVVPRIDCCTWLEFKTCPEELQRIIAKNVYTPDSVFSAQGNTPVWWTPATLGANARKISRIPDDDSYEMLMFSADSTHVFYCYSTD